MSDDDFLADDKTLGRSPVHELPPVLVRQDTTADRYAAPEYYDYWRAVTGVPCPACRAGVVRWAEAGYVPGYRICDGCGKHFMAKGSAEVPTLVELGFK